MGGRLVLLPGLGGSGRTKLVPNTGMRAAAANPPQHAYQTRLLPNTPNPFNPSTSIHYEIARESHARVDVFDARGAHIRTLIDAVQPAGSHRVEWNGTDAGGVLLSSGVYFYRLVVDGRVVETRKMALLK